MISREDVALIVFDFDGVMTDNRVLIDETGKESVMVSRADGMGVSILKKKGIPMLIISTETNPVVAKRAEKLNIPVIQGVENKEIELSNYCNGKRIPFKKVIYVGNDINDIEAMKLCGIVVVPNDAHYSVKNIANLILRSNGGYGVVRELADRIG